MSCLEMKCLSGIWKRILVLFAVFSMMIVSLPAYAERLPDFLAKIQPSEIFPGADRYGKPKVSLWLLACTRAKSSLAWFISRLTWSIRAVIRVNRSIRGCIGQ